MAFYAYRDPERNQIFYAKNWEIKDLHNFFYCENSNCRARLTIKAANSPMIKPYFSTLPSFPHIPGCYSNIKFNYYDESKYDEKEFEIEKFINHLINFTDPQLFSLSFLYYLCKSKSVDKKYNNSRIRDILIDSRSNYYYTKGVFGYHLIECKFFRYDNTKQQLIFKYPIDNKFKNKYTLKLDIRNSSLYKKLKQLIYNKREYPIVIAGFWRKEKGSFTTELTNRYQIYTPKNS